MKITGFWTLGGALVFGLATMACSDGGDVPEIDCATVTAVKYTELQIVGSCTSCHSAANAAAAGVPDGSFYETCDGLKKEATASEPRVANDEMPPTGGLSQTVKDEFYAWVQCGQPCE
jgi:Fe-S cluster biogenesis protein NfuA